MFENMVIAIASFILIILSSMTVVVTFRHLYYRDKKDIVLAVFSHLYCKDRNGHPYSSKVTAIILWVVGVASVLFGSLNMYIFVLNPNANKVVSSKVVKTEVVYENEKTDSVNVILAEQDSVFSKNHQKTYKITEKNLPLRLSLTDNLVFVSRNNKDEQIDHLVVKGNLDNTTIQKVVLKYNKVERNTYLGNYSETLVNAEFYSK